MLLHELQLKNFRNYLNTEVKINQKESNFLIGENGQGKTNFLEALHYISFGSSFKTKKEEQVVTHNQDYYRIFAEFVDEDISHTIEITYKNQKKTIKVNNSIINERKELLQYFPCVIFKHSDIFYISGGPEQQRLFLDQLLVLGHIDYTNTLQQYNRVLLQKNTALKQEQYSLISVYNEQLAQLGLSIMQYRRKAIIFINEYLSEMFSEIYGKSSAVSMEYFPSWKVFNEKTNLSNNTESIDTNYCLQIITKKQNENFEREKIYRYCLSGPQRDTIKILLNNHEFKVVGSTGQIRILSLLLRFLQAKYHFEMKKKSMVYLFDDVLLELDTNKQKRFLESLPKTQQSFYTFLPEETLPHIINTTSKNFFRVNNGMIEKLDEGKEQLESI